MCITETHLDSSFTDTQLFLSSDKTIYRKDRNLHGGGVLIAVDSEIPASVINIPTPAEIIAVQLAGPTYVLFIVCYYRPPHINDLDQVNDYLAKLKLLDPSAFIILTGDLNVPNIDWSPSTAVPNGQTSTVLLHLLAE